MKRSAWLVIDFLIAFAVPRLSALANTLTQTLIFLPVIETNCFEWSGEPSLQTAVNTHRYVEMQAGGWETNLQISMPTDHTLRGVGRDSTTLRAVEPWVGNDWEF